MGIVLRGIVIKLSEKIHAYLQYMATISRLPEELNGDGCFSSALFRVLSGYGYHMAHSRLVMVSYIAPELVSESTIPSRSCGCRALSSSPGDVSIGLFQRRLFM